MVAYVILADGFEEIETITVMDVLRRGGVNVKSVSLVGQEEVRGAHDIVVLADSIYEKVDWDNGEIIILPGGMPGAANIGAHSGIVNVIKDYNKNQKLIAAICAAPSVLGNIGILDGVEAACYPGYEGELGGAIISSKPVVKSGNIITSVGPGTAIMFAITILEALKGTDIANNVKSSIVMSEKSF